MSPGPNGPGTPGGMMQPSPQSVDGVPPPNPSNDPFGVMQRAGGPGGANSSGPPSAGYGMSAGAGTPANPASAISNDPMQPPQPQPPLHPPPPPSNEANSHSGPGPGVSAPSSIFCTNRTRSGSSFFRPFIICESSKLDRRSYIGVSSSDFVVKLCAVN